MDVIAEINDGSWPTKFASIVPMYYRRIKEWKFVVKGSRASVTLFQYKQFSDCKWNEYGYMFIDGVNDYEYVHIASSNRRSVFDRIFKAKQAVVRFNGPEIVEAKVIGLRFLAAYFGTSIPPGESMQWELSRGNRRERAAIPVAIGYPGFSTKHMPTAALAYKPEDIRAVFDLDCYSETKPGTRRLLATEGDSIRLCRGKAPFFKKNAIAKDPHGECFIRIGAIPSAAYIPKVCSYDAFQIHHITAVCSSFEIPVFRNLDCLINYMRERGDFMA